MKNYWMQLQACRLIHTYLHAFKIWLDGELLAADGCMSTLAHGAPALRDKPAVADKEPALDDEPAVVELNLKTFDLGPNSVTNNYFS
jgi:hypothetical protein